MNKWFCFFESYEKLINDCKFFTRKVLQWIEKYVNYYNKLVLNPNSDDNNRPQLNAADLNKPD